MIAVTRTALVFALVIFGATVGRAVQDPVFDRQPADAKFRYIAHEMYEELATPSCKQLGVPGGFDRMASLAIERAAVRKFEADVEATSAAHQLKIVKNDRLISGEDVGCMADDDIRFANKHVGWAKERTRRSLEQMLLLAPFLLDPPSPDLPPAVSAKFRKKVRSVVWRPECQQTSAASNEVLFAPSQRLIDDFRQLLIGSPYAFHFDVAEADVKLKDAITIAECDEPGSEPVAKLQKRYLDIDTKLIAELKTILVQPASGIAAKP